VRDGAVEAHRRACPGVSGTVAIRFDLRLEIHHILGACLRKSVSEAFAFENLLKVMRLLLFRALEANGIHNAKMVVSDLSDGRIGLSDCPKHLYDRGVLYPRSSEGFGNANCPETAPGKFIQFRLGQNPVSVSFGRSNSKFLSQNAGDRKWLAERYNRPNFPMFDYDVYALARGCLCAISASRPADGPD
jgi:hypothetical protein